MPIKLPITTFIMFPLAALMIGLAIRVASLRRSHRIGLGVGSNKALARARAAHGNAVENIPLAIILFALAELQGINAMLLISCGGIILLARCMSAFGVSRYAGHSFSRFYGILLNWLVLGILAVCNLWINLA